MKCLECGKLISNDRKRFCSRSCSQEYNNRILKAEANEKSEVRKLALVLLKGGACQKCGYNKNTAALEFHHREPENKKFKLDKSGILGRSWKNILQEAEKCDLVCANCHRETHEKKEACHPKSLSRVRTKSKLVRYKGGKCEICDYGGSNAALEFHHVHGKDFGISQNLQKTAAALKLEVKKCRLLCANCHREQHFSEYLFELDKAKVKIGNENFAKWITVSQCKSDILHQCPQCGKSCDATKNFCSKSCAKKSQPRKFEITVEEIRDFRAKKITWKKIAQMFGVSDNAVRKRARSMGLLS